MWQALLSLFEALGNLFLGIFAKGQATVTPPPPVSVPPVPTVNGPKPPPPTPTPIPGPTPPPVQNRVLYDSTNIFDIPTSAQMVGYFVDGLYAVSGTVVRARFPHAVLVPISAIGTNAGVVGDVENGDMTPASSVNWVLARRAAGVDPSLYFSVSLFGAIATAFRIRNVPLPHMWLADWTEVPHIIQNSYATQYEHPPYTGGHYDLSVVTAYWPGIG